MLERNHILLNLGCGNTAPAGWENCDSSWNAQLQKIAIVRKLLAKSGRNPWPASVRHVALHKPFPWPTSTVDCVYASHVLEHLDDRAVENFMRESYRVLKPGAPIRIVVPDLRYHAEKYLSSLSAERSGAGEFLYVLNLKSPRNRGLLLSFYDYVVGDPHVHKNMYDSVTLSALIARGGFESIVFSEYGKSLYIKQIRDVEFRESGYEGSLYAEGIKPMN